jgi:hypothetical protein
METLQLRKSKELSPVEVVLIENIYNLLNQKDKLIEKMVSDLDNYKQIIDCAHELQHITGWKSPLRQFQEQFFKYASVQTLEKIADEIKFENEYSYGEAFLISKSVLKDFRYGSEVRSDDPKARVAKKLGAKIIA